MKVWPVIIAIAIGSLSGCSADEFDKMSSPTSAENGGYLTKEQVVQMFMQRLPVKSTQTASAEQTLGAGTNEALPVDPDSGLPYKLMPPDELTASAMSPMSVDNEAVANNRDVDLRQSATPVKNQGGEGLCTAFATAAGMEMLAKIKTNRDFNLSERHLWNLYRFGDIFLSSMSASRSRIVSEETWPYGSGRPVKNTSGIMKISRLSGSLTLKQMIQALQNRQPVVWGGPAPVFGRKDGIIYAYYRGGGHSMLVVGVQHDQRVKGGGYFIIKNSWGTQIGDKGYVYMPFAYCAALRCYALAIEDVEITSDANGPATDAGPLAKNERIKAAIGGETAQADTYELVLAAPKEATRLVFCKDGQPAACTAGISGYTTTTLLRTAGEQAIFKADTALTLSPGLRIAVAALDANGQIIAQRSLMFERN